MAPSRTARHRRTRGGLGRLLALLGFAVGAGALGGALALLAIDPAGASPVPPPLAALAGVGILAGSLILLFRHGRPDRARRRRSPARPRRRAGSGRPPARATTSEPAAKAKARTTGKVGRHRAPGRASRSPRRRR